MLYAVTNGYLDVVPVANISAYEKDLLKFMEASYPNVIEAIAISKNISIDAEKKMKEAFIEFQQGSKELRKGMGVNS